MTRELLHRFDRRHFLGQAAYVAALWTTPGLFAEELSRHETHPMTEGPFYPDKLPLDTDNDLIIVNNSTTPAVGTIAHVSGKVLTKAGRPIRNAFVEIWQCDMNKSYLHTRGRNPVKGLDTNFQGYGRFLTNAKGEYYFRTIRPITYQLGGTFRAPHIHFAISQNGHRLLTTQLSIKGHLDNKRDGLLSRIRDPQAQATVLRDFVEISDSKIGEVAANFDIVVGHTVAEKEDGSLEWGLGKSRFSRPPRRGRQ